MNIAVVFALPAEFSPWRARHAFRRTNASGRQFYDGQIGPTSLRVAFSGVGAPEMRALADTAFDAPAGLVISAGIGGGLKPQYRRSDILVASRLRTTAVDRTLVLDDRLVSLASRCGATIVDSFVTVDRMILRAQRTWKEATLVGKMPESSYATLQFQAERRPIGRPPHGIEL